MSHVSSIQETRRIGTELTSTHRSLRFAKRYFYLTEDATEPKNLTAFIASEKAAGHSTAAWASQTGKGLLFFTKRAEDKATPAGIFNLVSFLHHSTQTTSQIVSANE